MNEEALTLDPARCALIIQDLQNDVMIEGGAFADERRAGAREGAERRREREGASLRRAAARASR